MQQPNTEERSGRLLRRMASLLGLVWGVGGVLYLLGGATLRLGAIALEGVSDMPTVYWIPTGAWIAFNAYAEGYRGFQKAFSPRVATRAQVLMRHPTLLRVALAPPFLMGLVDSTRKRLTVSWILVVTIVTLVTVVRALPQPARGIIDAGVVVGLGWGIVATVVMLLRSLTGRLEATDPELAGSEPSPVS